MADIKIEQSPVSAALASIPDLLMRATELRNQNQLRTAQENRLQQQFQMQKDQSTLNQSEQLFKMEMQKKQMGMDAAGYDNLEIVDYFNNLLLDDGIIESAGGYLNWTGNTIMPTHQEAWQKYKELATKTGKSITSSDYNLFNSNWIKLTQSKNERFKGQIGKLIEQGYGPSDVEQLLTENPIFAANISNLERYTDAASQKFYAGFQPKKSKGFMGRSLESPLATSAVITGALASPGLAYAGYQWAQMPSAQLKDAAKLVYNNELEDSRNAVKEARALLNEEKAKPRYKGKVGNVRAAKNILDEAQANHKRLQGTSMKDYQKALKEGTPWARASKYMPKTPGLLRGMVPAVAGTVGSTVGGFVGGESGAAVGRGIGGAVGMAAGGVPLTTYVAQRLAAKAPSIAARFKLMALADSPAIGYADLFGAAMSLGMGTIEVINAYKDWQKANR
tara:strand:- start:1048 stop:2394 length:1347 start_codon:yes stop_codon:yes gene_type:complete